MGRLRLKSPDRGNAATAAQPRPRTTNRSPPHPAERDLRLILAKVARARRKLPRKQKSYECRTAALGMVLREIPQRYFLSREPICKW